MILLTMNQVRVSSVMCYQALMMLFTMIVTSNIIVSMSQMIMRNRMTNESSIVSHHFAFASLSDSVTSVAGGDVVGFIFASMFPCNCVAKLHPWLFSCKDGWKWRDSSPCDCIHCRSYDYVDRSAARFVHFTRSCTYSLCMNCFAVNH